jgi:hypothetical protein
MNSPSRSSPWGVVSPPPRSDGSTLHSSGGTGSGGGKGSGPGASSSNKGRRGGRSQGGKLGNWDERKGGGSKPAVGNSNSLWPTYYDHWLIVPWSHPPGPRHHQALLAQQQQALLAQHQQPQGPLPLAYYGGHLQGAPLPSLGVFAPPGFYTPPPTPPSGFSTSWDQQSLTLTFRAITLQQPQSTNWYFNLGATSHVTFDPHSLTHPATSRYHVPSSIIVGDGSLLPVTTARNTSLTNSLSLNNVLVSPRLIKNLIYVRRFTIDNNCVVEFDPSSCSIKDLTSRREILRCNSFGPLYPMQLPSAHALSIDSTSSLWHHRLGHAGPDVMSKVTHLIPFSNKEPSTLCHACQLGRYTRLPFQSSSSRVSSPFELVLCDLWTSPVVSVSGFKYYLVIIDFSHYSWTPHALNLTPSTLLVSLPLCIHSTASP